MADKNIKEGDEVSWNWGGGHPSGTVAEIATEGKLAIESKGKMVHKNADEKNPAVHVEREGNDVVRRASELTKEGWATEEQEEQGGQERLAEKEKETENGLGDKKGDEEVAKENGDEAKGEKREREKTVDESEDAVLAEQKESEEGEGRESKKMKVEKTQNGDKKEDNKNGDQETTSKEGEMDLDKAENSESEKKEDGWKEDGEKGTNGRAETTPKKRGPGRPKKEAMKKDAPVVTDSPAKRTRSSGKASS